MPRERSSVLKQTSETLSITSIVPKCERTGLKQRQGSDSLAIAVHGKWGTGKTTAVNMVVDAFERQEADRDESKPTIIFRFQSVVVLRAERPHPHFFQVAPTLVALRMVSSRLSRRLFVGTFPISEVAGKSP